MIAALAILLCCQLAGEICARGLGLPVPGPVIGLLVLAGGAILYLRLTGAAADTIEETDLGRLATAMLGALGVLFVPAGVGVVQQLAPISAYLLPILLALFVSTALTLVVTVAVFLAVKRLSGVG